eukprot:6480917-Amphidinium_carterae.1
MGSLGGIAEKPTSDPKGASCCSPSQTSILPKRGGGLSPAASSLAHPVLATHVSKRELLVHIVSGSANNELPWGAIRHSGLRNNITHDKVSKAPTMPVRTSHLRAEGIQPEEHGTIDTCPPHIQSI